VTLPLPFRKRANNAKHRTATGGGLALPTTGAAKTYGVNPQVTAPEFPLWMIAAGGMPDAHCGQLLSLVASLTWHTPSSH